MATSSRSVSVLALVAQLLAPFAAPGLPSAPGFTIVVYASVTDPTHLAFAPDGTLYTGRDNLGSGGGAGDAVRIYRIGAGGSPVVEYGASAILDPDAVVVDVNGDIGTVGSVLVGSFVSVAVGGRITEVAPDESVTPLFTSTSFDNPSDMVIDSGGRLLFVNFGSGTPSGVYQSTGGVPTALFTTTPGLAYIALDPTERIFVGAEDGTISIYSSAGALIDGAFVTGLGTRPPLAIGPLGNLVTGVLTVNPAGELLHVDLSGTSTVVGSGFEATNDLKFGPDGALYLAEFDNDQVLRMVPAPPQVPFLNPASGLLLVLLIAGTGLWRLGGSARARRLERRRS